MSTLGMSITIGFAAVGADVRFMVTSEPSIKLPAPSAPHMPSEPLEPVTGQSVYNLTVNSPGINAVSVVTKHDIVI